MAWLWGKLLPQIAGLKLVQVPGLMSRLCFTRTISKLLYLISLGGIFGQSSDGQRREKGDKGNAFQLEELSRALCALAALNTQRGDNGLSTGQRYE